MYGANGVRSSIQGRDVIDQKKLVTTHEVTALTSRSRSKLYTMRHAGDFPQLAATCTKGRFCWVAQVAELPFARTGRMLSAERPIPAVQLLMGQRLQWPISGSRPHASEWPLDFGNGRCFRGDPNDGNGSKVRIRGMRDRPFAAAER